MDDGQELMFLLLKVALCTLYIYLYHLNFDSKTWNDNICQLWFVVCWVDEIILNPVQRPKVRVELGSAQNRAAHHNLSKG